MAYASVAEFVEVVGETEARALASVPGSPTVRDDAKIADAIEDASATLNTYIAGRFPTPVSPVPRALRRYTIDLARESLMRIPSDAVVRAGDRARAWAKDLARGLVTLGSTEDGDPPPPPAGGGPAIAAPAPTFDGQMDGYLPVYGFGGGGRWG